MNFRRYYVPGSAVFITQVVEGQAPVFTDARNVRLLHETVEHVKSFRPFVMLAYVFLPDHFHLILQPPGDSNFSDIMHSLKPNFTRAHKEAVGVAPSESLKFWQKRFWDHVIRDDRDLEHHLHYIHYNPVKHGCATDPRNWKDSSYIGWEERELYPPAFQWDEPKRMSWGK